MRKRLIKALVLTTAFLTAGIIYGIFFGNTGIGIPCLINKIFKIKCPGCGITHFISCCFRFNFSEAFSYNYFGLPICLYLAYIYIDNCIHYVKEGKPAFSKALSYLSVIFGIMAIVWAVVRNIVGV